jgi:membrane protease YdiL (CAAX protease family)
MLVVSEYHTQADTTTNHSPLAPWTHTLFLLGVLVLWAIYGALRSYLPVSAMPHMVTYTSGIIVQYLLVGSTIAGLYHRRRFIRSVLGYWSLQGVGRDFAIGILVYIGGLILLASMSFAIRFTPLHSTYKRQALQSMMPQSFSELALWILVGLTAGFCEEFVFRGYLQQQMANWFRSIPIGIGISALLFGCMHFYQGTGAALQITGLGVLYGIVAARRGNLRSVMVAHALQDVVVALHYYLN